MKVIQIFASVALVSIASIATAQQATTDSREMLRFGLKAGMNYSNVYDERTDSFEADSKIGFAGGGFLRIPIGRFLGVQPEVLFSQKGFKGSGRFMGNEYNLTRTTNHIDIPLMVALKPTDFLTLVAGPHFSYLLSRRDVFSNSTISIAQQQEFENDKIRKNTFGFIAGLDVDINRVVVGARFGWDAQTNHGDGSSSTPRYKNAWIQGTIGFIF